jgi:hypothetical protein
MGIEAFAEAALRSLPGWHVEAIEDIDFLAPFKFYRNEPRTLTVEAIIHQHGNDLVADCRLMGIRPLPNQNDPQTTTHFTAHVRLAARPPKEVTRAPFCLPAGSAVEAAELYRVYFHGPAYQVVERVWWDGKRIVALMAKDLPANHQPSELRTRMSPRLIELCFQSAGVWEMGAHGRFGLPQHIDRVSLLRTPELAEGRLYAVVTPEVERGSFDAEVVDAAGNCYVQLQGYRTVVLPNAVNADHLRGLQALVSADAVLAG